MANDERDGGLEEMELPPAFEKFKAQLKADKKVLMRDKAYGQSPEQLRAFIGTYLYPRLQEFLQIMGLGLYDTYGLAVSSENQIKRMRAVYGKALKKLGADVEDEDGDLPGLSPEILDEFQQAFYALGTLLQTKLPEDKETEKAYNKCAEILSDMVAELMGDDEDDEDEDEDDEDDDEAEGEKDGKTPRRSSKEPKTPKPDADAKPEKDETNG